MRVVPIDVYAIICDGQDGSAYIEYYLDKDVAQKLVDDDELYYANDGQVETIETYHGSNIHKRASNRN